MTEDWFDEFDRNSREIELEEEFTRRQDMEEDEQRKQKEILEQDFSAEEVKIIKRKAENIGKYYAYDKWRLLFDKVSFCNEVPGQVLFHVLLGQLLKDHKIQQSGDIQEDLRLHFFWIQDSGSGKSRATEFLRKVSERFYVRESESKKRILRVYKMGKTTDASMINSWRYDNKKREYTTIPQFGILAKNDIIYWEEANKLITGGQFSEETQEIVMTAVEPIGSRNNVYQKELRDYPAPAETTCEASFVAVTRPLENLKPQLLYNGLLQRFVTYFRTLDDSERQEMFDRASLSSFKDKNDTFLQELDLLVDEIKKIVDFSGSVMVDLEPKERARLLKHISNKISWFTENIVKSVFSGELQNILHSFNSRIRNNMIVVASHSALMRGSKVVQEEDIEYSFELMKKCFLSIKDWMELNFTERVDDIKNKRQRIVGLLLKKNGGKMKKSLVVDELIQLWKLSKDGVYKYLKRLENVRYSRFKHDRGYYYEK